MTNAIIGVLLMLVGIFILVGYFFGVVGLAVFLICTGILMISSYVLGD